LKFLVDNALSPEVAAGLRRAGHEAVHARDLHLQQADDDVLLARAAEAGQIVVSADTDFGTLLALHRETKPSVILFRQTVNRRPERQVAVLAANLPAIQEALEQGAVVVFEDARVRVRTLPIGWTEGIRERN
jgi:predicted nuclease of predicted toxin-antitoxin system